MAISIDYTAGNGYHCGCCRQSWEGEVYAQNAADVLADCIDEARSADWDFRIDCIQFFDEPEDAGLLDRLKAGIKLAEQTDAINEKLACVDKALRDIEQWFATLEEQQVAQRAKQVRVTAEREQLLQELHQLQGSENAMK